MGHNIQKGNWRQSKEKMRKERNTHPKLTRHRAIPRKEDTRDSTQRTVTQ